MEKEKNRVVCGGPGTEENHPRIYLYTAQNKLTTCPYCGKNQSKAYKT